MHERSRPVSVCARDDDDDDDDYNQPCIRFLFLYVTKWGIVIISHCVNNGHVLYKKQIITMKERNKGK